MNEEFGYFIELLSREFSTFLFALIVALVIVFSWDKLKEIWFTKSKIILALIFLTFGCSSPEPKVTEPEHIRLHKMHLEENQKRIDSVLNERAEEKYTEDDFKFINK